MRTLPFVRTLHKNSQGVAHLQARLQVGSVDYGGATLVLHGPLNVPTGRELNLNGVTITATCSPAIRAHGTARIVGAALPANSTFENVNAAATFVDCTVGGVAYP